MTAETGVADGAERREVLFKAVAVFDRSQVAPIDCADPKPCRRRASR